MPIHRDVRWCFALAFLSLVDCTLLSVFTITRHGNRAPNPSVQDLCPAIAGDAEQIKRDFGVAPGFLTRKGHQQVKLVGEFLREYYLSGPTPRLEMPHGESDSQRAQHFHFQAPSSQRHISSAKALAEGLLPGINRSLLNVHPGDDNLVTAPPVACASRNRDLCFAWMRRDGVSGFYSDKKPVVRAVEKICQRRFVEKDYHFEDTTVGNPHPPFQDVVDLMDFRAGEGLPEPDGWPEIRYEARKLALDGVLQRTFETDMQKVMWLAALPQKIRGMFAEASSPLLPRILMTNYVTSREIHYAFEEYFHFKFNITAADTPIGAILPGTSIIMEFHADTHVLPGSSTRDNKKVRVGYVSPPDTSSGGHLSDVSVEWVKLPGCDDVMCEFGQFMNIIATRERQAGGGFVALCSPVDVGHAPVAFLAMTSTAVLLAVFLSLSLYRRRGGYVEPEATEYTPLGDEP